MFSRIEMRRGTPRAKGASIDGTRVDRRIYLYCSQTARSDGRRHRHRGQSRHAGKGSQYPHPSAGRARIGAGRGFGCALLAASSLRRAARHHNGSRIHRRRLHPARRKGRRGPGVDNRGDGLGHGFDRYRVRSWLLAAGVSRRRDLSDPARCRFPVEHCLRPRVVAVFYRRIRPRSSRSEIGDALRGCKFIWIVCRGKRPAVPVDNQIRTYWWCSPPRIGRQRICPARSTARENGASFCKDRCVRPPL